MIDRHLQVSAINIGLSYKGLLVLIYLRDHFYIQNIKSIDIQNTYPLFFNSSADTKGGIDELVNNNIITCRWTRGNISNIVIDGETLKGIFDNESLVINKVVVKKKVTKEDPRVSLLVSHYNEYPELPKPSTLTANVRAMALAKLELYNEDSIKDAITFASEQQWLTNKADERWCNLLWVLRNIEGFMEGGKYRKGKETSTKTNPILQMREDKNNIVII